MSRTVFLLVDPIIPNLAICPKNPEWASCLVSLFY